MQFWTTPVAIAALLSLIFWAVFCHRGPSWPKSLVKTASVALLALASLPMEMPLVTAALAFGALGDFCLSRPGQRWFLAGMGAFALTHLAYIAALWPIMRGLKYPVAAAGLVIFGLVMAVLLWRRAGALRGPVLAYLVIILAMGIVSLSLGFAPWMLTLAALLFIASDSLLATELFLLRKDHPVQLYLPFLVWPTYWLAQAWFLWGFSAISG